MFHRNHQPWLGRFYIWTVFFPFDSIRWQLSLQSRGTHDTNSESRVFILRLLLQFEAIEDGNDAMLVVVVVARAVQPPQTFFHIFEKPLFSHSIPTPIFTHQSVDLFHVYLFIVVGFFLILNRTKATNSLTCDFQNSNLIVWLRWELCFLN